MADERDSLLREVDEELRREQMQKLWERYNGIILGAAALIVALVAGYKIMESRRITAMEKAGSEFAQALKLADEKKSAEADKAFQEIVNNGTSGYAALSKLHLAGEAAKAGKTAEALSLYDSLGKDASADELLKSYAQLQAAGLRMGEADFTEMQNRLTPLAGDSSAFRVSARELLGFAAFKAGKYDEARKFLEPLLIDPKASAAIQERIKVVMGEIASSEVAGKAGANPATAAPAAATSATANDPEKSGATGTKPAEPEKK